MAQKVKSLSINSNVAATREWPAVVLVQPTPDVGRVPLRGMVEGLARCLVQDYDDDVLVLVVVRGDVSPDLEAGDKPHRLVVAVPEEQLAAGAAVLRALDEHAPTYAYTFIDASELGYAFVDFLVAFLGEASFEQPLHRRLARLTRVAPGSPPTPERIKTLPANWTVVRTELLGEAPPVAPRALELARYAWKRFLVRLGRGRPEPRGEPHPSWFGSTSGRIPEEVRVRLTYPEGVEATSSDVGGSFSRWGRALTNRRVGLALGGSGAWGYAHAALIDVLEERGIPIDLISSASSGSVIAAYYSVLGPDGTRMVIERGERLEWAVTLAMISSAALELTVAADTGFQTLDQLEVMFYPVATNLSTMAPEYITRASVPWGVRASSTAPGVFGSTVTSEAIYVDGAVADNVPARLVEYLGADLVIATNPLPPPPVMHPGTLLAMTLHELNPMFRFRELIASFDLMFHSFGDYDSSGYICYDPPPAIFPLMRTFNFKHAYQIYQAVRDEPEFQSTADIAAKQWRWLTRPRTGGFGDDT